MTPRRIGRVTAIALLGLAACDNTPYNFGSMDAGVDNGRVEKLVPAAPVLPCDDTGQVVPPTECPATVMDRSECAHELETCDTQTSTGESSLIKSCLCVWAADGVKRWLCEAAGTAGTLGCPQVQPKDGDVCTEALSCSFVERPTCSCPTDGLFSRAVRCQCGQDLAWHCEAEPGATPMRSCSLAAGSPLDAAKRIADLTDDEALTWCEWVAHNVPTKDALDPPPALVVDGFATASSGGYYSGYPFHPMCWAKLPHDLCVRNLKLDPCQATVQMLDDCVLTQGSRFHGRGCGPFQLAPGCQRTFFQEFEDQETYQPCRIPVQ